MRLAPITNHPDEASVVFAAPGGLGDRRHLPHKWREARLGERPEALVLSDSVTDADVQIMLEKMGDPLIPIISLVDRGLRNVDAVGEDATVWARAHAIVERLRRLPDKVRYGSRIDAILLALLFSRETDLTPVHDASARDFVGYPTANRIEGVAEAALRLYDRGLLTRRFFDRINICADCRSARLSVREECHSCRSPDIHEETIVHHFKCAHEGPESTFRTGRRLECPKCGTALRHIGLDYDKPGSVTCCGSCGAINDMPTVGFKCMDCGRHHTSEQVPTRDWYSFKITPNAVQQLLGGMLEDDERSISGPEGAPHVGPDAFRMLLEQVRREQREFNSSYQILRLNVTNATDIMAEDIRLWNMSLNLINDALHSALREVDALRQESDYSFLLLLPRTNRRGAEQLKSHIRKRFREVLKIDAEVAFEFLDEVAIRALSGGHFSAEDCR